MTAQNHTNDPAMAHRLARLAEVLDSYGGDANRWPAPERAGLEDLLARSPQARVLHADALAFDQLLAFSPATTATAPLELMARIQRAAVAPNSQQPAQQPPRRDRQPWLFAASLAACVAAGIYLGSLSTVADWIDPLFSQGGGQELTEVIEPELGLADDGDVL